MANRTGSDAPRVLALAGPTASGKSAAAMAIAREHGCEIVSVDSALVYRGMDIGTAKPTAAELAAVPHHLIDIRDPLQAYSAAEFVTDALRLIDEIRARGKRVLLVGGTMLYFKALFEGLDAPLLSLEPQDRAWLHTRIAERFDAMLAAGFLDEVKALRARGDLNADLPSMRCVGYRQAWELLDAQQAQGGDFPMETLRDRGIFATRQLAKRQLTWLRSMPQREVIACDAPDALEQVLARAREIA
jgi:tRNA A37 N6-isopentenylltransferase MiaA